MGIFDSIKTTIASKNIWNVVKKPLSGLWSGMKSVDSVVSNPIVETGLTIGQPELAPFLAGYDIAKYGLEKLGVGQVLDDVLN